MKNLNNYIVEKFEISSKNTSIMEDNNKMDLVELINSIFPIEEHKDLWKNCKWYIETTSKHTGKNEDVYKHYTYINFNDEILIQLNVIYYEISRYGAVDIKGPCYDIFVNSKHVDFFKNDKLKKLIFKNTPAEKIINDITDHFQYIDGVNDQNINDYIEVFTDILKKYAKDNGVNWKTMEKSIKLILSKI